MLIKENFQCTQKEFDETKSSHNIAIQCLHCQDIFQRPKKAIVSDLSRRGHYPTCCSVKCLNIYKQQFNRTLVNCKYCNTEFLKLNKEIIKSPNNFCTMSCAAKFHNAAKPKIIKIIKEKPTKEILPEKSTLDDTSKGDLFSNRTTWQNARSAIQRKARKTFNQSNKLKQCVKCGYNKHYEVCHINSVASFPDETLIKNINSIDNLIALCPTHHWEFDNGHLTLEFGGSSPI